MHMLRQTCKWFQPFTSNFKRVPSVHLMNNAWVDNSNSCFQRSITHEWAPGISSPVFFIHTHKVPCSFKEILDWTLWNIIGCKKRSNTLLFPGKSFTQHRPSQIGCTKTEKNKPAFLLPTYWANEHKLLRSRKGWTFPSFYTLSILSQVD